MTSASSSSATTWFRTRGALFRRAPFATVIALDASSTIVIDGVASAVWDTLEAPATDAELVARCADLADPSEIISARRALSAIGTLSADDHAPGRA